MDFLNSECGFQLCNKVDTYLLLSIMKCQLFQ